MSTEHLFWLVILLLSNPVFALILTAVLKARSHRGIKRPVYDMVYSQKQFKQELIGALQTTALPPIILGLSIYM